MMTIYYNKDTQFDLTEQEFQDFIKASTGGKKVWVPRLKVFLSDMFLWAGEKPATSVSEMLLHDGTKAIKRNGQWVNAYNPEAKIDPHYYPEILGSDKALTV